MKVKVGIFWVIGGKAYVSRADGDTDDPGKRAALTGMLDSELEHFAVWDTLCAPLFPDADFATYPRGRVMYDIGKRRHVIYADRCIDEAGMEQIKSMFSVEEYTVERDAHYRCDICMRKKQLPKLEVEDGGDSYRVELTSSYGVLKRTIDKSGGDRSAFEDILDEVSVTERNGRPVCKFAVDVYPPSAFTRSFTEHTGIAPLYTVKDRIRYKVIDGENKIGANLIELFYNDVRVLVECGKELEPTEAGQALREKTVKKHYDACFISHYHGDHAGLLTAPVNCDRIYMGEYTLGILKTIGGICEKNAAKTVTFTAGREIDIRGLKAVPYLCDHSAYDSYMLLFKSERNSLLYTGDFRSGGRKDFGGLLSKLPKSVDTIICEGTNLNSAAPSITERQVEDRLVGILSGTDKPVFVLQSATNIDRIVSVYRAAIRSDRVFIMRLIQADICEKLPSIPQPNGYKKCFVYSEFPLTDDKHKAYVQKYGKRFIGRAAISEMDNCVLEVTSKDLVYLQKLGEMKDLSGAKLIYSTWSGYKEREDMAAFLAGVEAMGMETVDLHASGHADAQAIARLLNTVGHRECIFVHKEGAE